MFSYLLNCLFLSDSLKIPANLHKHLKILFVYLISLNPRISVRVTGAIHSSPPNLLLSKASCHFISQAQNLPLPLQSLFGSSTKPSHTHLSLFSPGPLAPFFRSTFAILSIQRTPEPSSSSLLRASFSSSPLPPSSSLPSLSLLRTLPLEFHKLIRARTVIISLYIINFTIS